MKYEVVPYKHGDWKVVEKQPIEVTTKDSGQREFIYHDKAIFIGSLEKCNAVKTAKDK